jgi:hypothetical protein
MSQYLINLSANQTKPSLVQHSYTKTERASSGPCSRGLLLTRQPLYWAELSRRLVVICVVFGVFKCWFSCGVVLWNPLFLVS